MRIIDTHCDVLMKLWKSNGQLTFSCSDELAANKERLLQGGIMAQGFAIFVPPAVKVEQKFQAALDQIHYFYEEVLGKNPEMKHIKEWSDFDLLREGEIGAMLILEGVDAIGNDLRQLQMLYRLGVLSVGLTWNNANLAADGVWEPRGAGLTGFGKEIVRLNNAQRRLTDVAHLSEKAFWDVMELADYPYSSHSNARAICDDPRNLTDEQAKAIFEKGGTIHVFYSLGFVKKGENKTVTIPDLIKHIDHYCSLGGVRHIGIGSDFDGITKSIDKLENAALSQNLINELLNYYKEDEVRGFAADNFLRCRPQ